MAEKNILRFKPALRLEQVGDEHSERAQDRKYRSQGCDDSALRCESRPDGIFGKDKGMILNYCDGSLLRVDCLIVFYDFDADIVYRGLDYVLAAAIKPH